MVCSGELRPETLNMSIERVPLLPYPHIYQRTPHRPWPALQYCNVSWVREHACIFARNLSQNHSFAEPRRFDKGEYKKKLMNRTGWKLFSVKSWKWFNGSSFPRPWVCWSAQLPKGDFSESSSENMQLIHSFFYGSENSLAVNNLFKWWELSHNTLLGIAGPEESSVKASAIEIFFYKNITPN